MYGLEVVNRYETNILNTAQQVWYFMHPSKLRISCSPEHLAHPGRLYCMPEACCHKQAVELIGDLGMDNVRVHLDTYHMNIEENSMEQAALTAGDKLGCAASALQQMRP